MVGLRVVHTDDWALWRELRLRALADAPYAFSSTLEEWQNATEARWRERLELPESRNLIALVDGHPVGMATGAPFDGVEEVIGMWVGPEARGRGVGDALLADICLWAAERGAADLHLDVAEGNIHAIALYIRNGFVDIGPSREARERLMVKKLQ